MEEQGIQAAATQSMMGKIKQKDEVINGGGAWRRWRAGRGRLSRNTALLHQFRLFFTV